MISAQIRASATACVFAMTLQYKSTQAHDTNYMKMSDISAAAAAAAAADGDDDDDDDDDDVR